MADNFNILLGSKIDTSQKTINQMNEQIKYLSKNLASLKLKIDTKEIQTLSNQVKKIVESISTKPKQLTVFDEKQLQDAGVKFTKITGQMVNAMEHVRKQYMELGQTTVKGIKIDPLTKNVETFTISVKESDGVIKNFKHSLIELQNGSKAFKLDTITGVDKSAETQAKLRQQAHEIRSKISNEEIAMAHKEALAMNKRYDQEMVKIRQTIGTYQELKNANLQAKDVAALLSREYGNLEVRGYSLNRATGEYSVLLRQSSKENLSLRGSIDQTTGALRVQNQTVQQARNIQLGFFDQLKIAIQRVPIWLGATTIYFQSMRFGRQLIEDISEVNASMIELERVSSATQKELDNFRLTSPAIASSLGVLNQEVQTTTSEIVRLGYSLQEAEELMKLSSVMKTVGDLRDIGDATDYLISIMKSFKVEVEGATEIVDYLNHVANTSSINMGALGEGLKRMSSSMSAANNSIEETVGLLVSGFDITRDAEKTATALNTISIKCKYCGFV